MYKIFYLLGAAICLGGIYMFNSYVIHLDDLYPKVGVFVASYGGLFATIYHYYLTYLKK